MGLGKLAIPKFGWTSCLAHLDMDKVFMQIGLNDFFFLT
jgi:hypothetical protein